MKARHMLPGRQYRLDGKIIEAAYLSTSGAWYIVHPPGEPDMQSCFGIRLDADVEEVKPAGREHPNA